MWLGTRVPKAKGMPKGHKACMSQGDVPRHEGAEGDKKLACLQGNAREYRKRHKAYMSQGDVARHGGAEGDTKLTCLQGNVARYRGAEGKVDAKAIKLACRKAMCLGTGVPKATQSLHVAERCA
ncbi:hypothetical protein L3X38_045346 [Prunus dulcis]|uniref:Uncharacterized protein n=1 Tax=Prunus dulcis TaxID=3755 RepID=A0AAD4V077_PRUDU|nr:hypothetical protein L3X38_045346 [Prunus dulcis]